MKLNCETFDIQEGKLGRPFRLSGTEIKRNGYDRIICTITTFKYLDDKGGFFKYYQYRDGTTKITKE